MQWPEEARRDAGGLESLQDFISLPRDEEGRPIISTPRVTALVEAKEAWATELGTLDAVPSSITRGQLVTSSIAAPSQHTAVVFSLLSRTNHYVKRTTLFPPSITLSSSIREFIVED